MSYTIVFTPEAEAQLVYLYACISAEASPEITARFTDGSATYCESQSNFPARGSSRDDVRPGLRVIGYRKRVAIAFHVDEGRANIIGVFYGGQDYEAALLEEE